MLEIIAVGCFTCVFFLGMDYLRMGLHGTAQSRTLSAVNTVYCAHGVILHVVFMWILFSLFRSADSSHSVYSFEFAQYVVQHTDTLLHADDFFAHALRWIVLCSMGFFCYSILIMNTIMEAKMITTHHVVILFAYAAALFFDWERLAPHLIPLVCVAEFVAPVLGSLMKLSLMRMEGLFAILEKTAMLLTLGIFFLYKLPVFVGQCWYTISMMADWRVTAWVTCYAVLHGYAWFHSIRNLILVQRFR